MEYRVHLGIYGLVNNKNSILYINKNRGPYKNRYDLPGGSQKEKEGLKETLYREIQEETGYSVKKIKKCRSYDFFVKSEEFEGFVHHIAIIYDIEISEKNTDIKILENDQNDSSGIEWVNIKKINIYNSSPLLLKIKDEILDSKDIFDTVVYNEWKVLLKNKLQILYKKILGNFISAVKYKLFYDKIKVKLYLKK